MGFSEAVEKLNEQRKEILANLANYVHCLDNEPADDGDFYDYYCFDISACKGIWMYLANNDGFLDKPDRFKDEIEREMVPYIPFEKLNDGRAVAVKIRTKENEEGIKTAYITYGIRGKDKGDIIYMKLIPIHWLHADILKDIISYSDPKDYIKEEDIER